MGNQSFLDGVLRVIRQRCRILGLELPPAVIQQNLLVNHRQEPLVFHVISDDDGYGSEHGDSPPALPERPQLEAALEEPELSQETSPPRGGEVDQAEPIARTSRRRDTGNRRDDDEPKSTPMTVAERQSKNLLAFLSEPDG